MTDEENITKIIDAEKAISEITKIATKSDSNFIEAAVHYAEQHGLEIETVASLIRRHPSIKSKVRLDAEDAKMIERKHARLPV